MSKSYQELYSCSSIKQVKIRGETLDNFDDRLQLMAVKAFGSMPELFVSTQVITRFCYGLLDREAGLSIFMQEPGSLQQAKTSVRKYQLSYQVMYGKGGKHTTKQEEERISAIPGRANIDPGAII